VSFRPFLASVTFLSNISFTGTHLYFFFRDASSEQSADGENSERYVSGPDGSDAASASSPDQATHEAHGPSPFSSPFLSFREPGKNIQQLRQLALQGREETLREEAEGRKKVVWGSVDGLRDAQVRREMVGDGDCAALGGGMLPSADDRLESCEVGGVAVGDGDEGMLVVEDGVVADRSALGLIHGPGSDLWIKDGKISDDLS
jgi:hypothetical protein